MKEKKRIFSNTFMIIVFIDSTEESAFNICWKGRRFTVRLLAGCLMLDGKPDRNKVHVQQPPYGLELVMTFKVEYLFG